MTPPNIIKKTAVIMAGGTGGHIFPGLSVANAMQQTGWTIHWLGSQGGMEETLVNDANIPIHLLTVVGLRGNGILGWIKAPFMLMMAVTQALSFIRLIKPDVVIGFGGFASGPGGIAAFILGKKLVIHEQNAVAGMTNKMLSKLSTVVFQAFPNALKSKNGSITVGNPIRQSIAQVTAKKLKLAQDCVNVLVIGGSRGASIMNEQLPEIFAPFIKQKKIVVHHQCGKGNYQKTHDNYQAQLINSDVEINEFINDIDRCYQWADIVICRAGASTVSEVAAVGIAAIFIPYPFAVDDHQTRNAEWLAAESAAIIIPQDKLLLAESRQIISELIHSPEMIYSMANKANKIAYLNAATEITETCDRLLEKVA